MELEMIEMYSKFLVPELYTKYCRANLSAQSAGNSALAKFRVLASTKREPR